jgi:hypothetical protein
VRSLGTAQVNAFPLNIVRLKIIFVLWERQVPYDESYHLATMARQQLRQRPKKIA